MQIISVNLMLYVTDKCQNNHRLVPWQNPVKRNQDFGGFSNVGVNSPASLFFFCFNGSLRISVYIPPSPKKGGEKRKIKDRSRIEETLKGK